MVYTQKVVKKRKPKTSNSLPLARIGIAVVGLAFLTALLARTNASFFSGGGTHQEPPTRVVLSAGGRNLEVSEYAKRKGRLVDEIVQRESGYRNIPCEYSPTCVEFGVAQFKKPTFDLFCRGEWKDPYDQIDCLAEMVKAGKGYHWATYHAALATIK